MVVGSSVWERVLQPGFPTFEVASDPAALSCIGWKDIAFAPAALSGPSLAHCQTDGPAVVFDGQSRATLVFSALDHFTTNVPATSAAAISVATQGAPIPTGTTMCALLLARPGPTRAMRAWGAFMRQKYNTTRSRGPATTGLSYWDDNQAGYSYWSVDNHLDIWGRPEDIFVDLISAYESHGIRFQSWETDQNFLGSMCPACNNTDGFGWKDVGSWNSSLFPSGNQLSHKLGDLPMVFYISTFCRDNIYRDTQGGKYRFVNISGWTGDVLNAVLHPDDAHAAYTDILGPLKREANMQMLFTDFLCWRGPELQRHLPGYFEADHKFLEGMTLAA